MTVAVVDELPFKISLEPLKAPLVQSGSLEVKIIAERNVKYVSWTVHVHYFERFKCEDELSNLLLTGQRYEPTQEIIYRDLVRYDYRTFNERVCRAADALTKAGCEKLFTDKVSGAKLNRPGLTEALNFVRAGDTLVIWKLDRLGRSVGVPGVPGAHDGAAEGDEEEQVEQPAQRGGVAPLLGLGLDLGGRGLGGVAPHRLRGVGHRQAGDRSAIVTMLDSSIARVSHGSARWVPANTLVTCGTT